MGWIITIWFLLIFVAFVAGIALRFYKRSLPPIILRQVSRSAAWEMVEDFVWNSFEDKFAFPSGWFPVNYEKSGPDLIVADETAVLFDTNLKQIMASIVYYPSKWFGTRGFIVGVVLALIASPFALTFWILEIVFRSLLRSQIRVNLSDVPDDHESTQITFVLRGPSALLLGPNIARGLMTPTIPSRLRTLAGLDVVPASEPMQAEPIKQEI